MDAEMKARELAALADEIEQMSNAAPLVINRSAVAISPIIIGEWVERLRALEQPASAAGFVMVPVIPTQDMAQIGVDQYHTDNSSDVSIQGKVRRIYANMIAAAPKQGSEK
jgi:hypothetical protein